MANGKNKIIVYADWIDVFEELENDEAGLLIKHFFRYVNDLNPELNDKYLKLAWLPIEKTLKRDLKKWVEYIDKQKLNGSKGGRPKKPKKPIGLLENPTKPKKGDSDSDSDSVNDSVNDSDSEIRNKYNKRLLDSFSIIEDIAKKNTTTVKVVNLYINKFFQQVESRDVKYDTFLKYKEHFRNWFNINKPKNNNATKNISF